ncbi:MAG: TetR/AcrR family transcriptional regulator [Dehalococcoidia bacterium]
MPDTREALIAAGLRLFTTQGYAATGVQQIVGEAGVPKGSFYNHFASKEAYCAAVLDRYMDTLLARLEAPDGRANPVASVRAFHERLFQVLGQRPGTLTCMLGSFATEVDESAAVLSEAMANGIERWVRAYETLFAEAQARGQVRTDIPARQLAETFWNQWQGGLAQMRLRRSTESLESSFAAMLSMLLAPSNAALDSIHPEGIS